METHLSPYHLCEQTEKSAFVNNSLTRTRVWAAFENPVFEDFRGSRFCAQWFCILSHRVWQTSRRSEQKSTCIPRPFFPGERRHSSISFFPFFFFFAFVFAEGVFFYSYRFTHVYTDCPSVHTNDIQAKSIPIKAYGGLDTNSFKNRLKQRWQENKWKTTKTKRLLSSLASLFSINGTQARAAHVHGHGDKSSRPTWKRMRSGKATNENNNGKEGDKANKAKLKNSRRNVLTNPTR